MSALTGAQPLPRLDALGLKYRTDKASHHHDYLHFYERFLADLRYERMCVLEIGVDDGDSLRMWEEFFPHATIIGVDIKPDCQRHAAGRVIVELVDQSDLPSLARLARSHGPFGLVVDDGSHLWEHQLTSLRQLYPHVQPGGFYILEDLDTGFGDYVSRYRGTSTVRPTDYLRQFGDCLLAGGKIDLAAQEDAFIRSCVPITEFMTFSRRASVLRRRPAG